MAGPPTERRRRLGRLRRRRIEHCRHAARPGRVSTDRHPGQIRRPDGPGRSIRCRPGRRRRSASDAIGKDKTFYAAILANCALADMVPWRQVPTQPFEWFCLPQRWQREIQTAGGTIRVAACDRGRAGEVSSRSAAKSDHAARCAAACGRRRWPAGAVAGGRRQLPGFAARDRIRRDEPGQHGLPGTRDRRTRHRVFAVVRAGRRELVGARSNLATTNTALAIESLLAGQVATGNRCGVHQTATHIRHTGRIRQPSTTQKRNTRRRTGSSIRSHRRHDDMPTKTPYSTISAWNGCFNSQQLRRTN